LSNAEESRKIADKIASTYHMRVPSDVIASAFANQPRLPVQLSRAAFRPNIRMQQGTRLPQGRRHFLRNLLALAGVGVFGLALFELGSFLSQPEVGTNTSAVSVQSGTASSNPAGGATTVSTLPSNAGRLLANASDIPSNGSLNLNDPTYGAIILIHLDNGSYVAYSSVCTHAGCQVQFDPSIRDIACPCHGALFDPYNGAQVLRGPARTPLQNIPIQYDASSGNIYVTS